MPITICSTSIDWIATGSMLQGIGTVGGVAAVIWAAIKGANTFDTWSRQKLTERKLEQAERILTATYKARRALGYLREPIIWGHELHAAEQHIKEMDGWAVQTEARQKRLITAQAFFNRINRTKDDVDALDQCLPLARALFSKKLEQAIEKLCHQFWTVQVHVEAYAEDEYEYEYDTEFTKNIRRAMYAITPSDGEINEVTEALETAVATIERICLPALHLETNSAAP